MRWQGRRESGNVEDRRSMAPAGMAVGGGASILLIVLYLLIGGDPADLQQMPGPQGQEQQGPLDPAPHDPPAPVHRDGAPDRAATSPTAGVPPDRLDAAPCSLHGLPVGSADARL